MIVQIGLPILLLAALVVAYLSAKTWGWGHVSLGLALFFATLGFLVLGAETLRIHAVLRKQVQDRETRLAQVAAQDAALIRGTDDPQIINQLAAAELTVPEGAEEIPGINELRHQTHLVTRIRGRVWREVAPAGPPDAQTFAVKVRVAAPDPHGIAEGTLVYAFLTGPAPSAQQPQGASFLGEFRVVGDATGPELTLVPVMNWAPTDAEVARLAAAVQARAPWELYEAMPVDRHDIFAGMTEEQLRQILPPQSVEEYIRQGTEAKPDDDEWHRVGYDADGNRLGIENWDKAVTFRYERQLRDYGFLFHELAQRRTELIADIAAVKQDTERLNAALVSAKQLEQYRIEEKRKLQHDLAGMQRDLAAIEQLQTQVEQQLTNARQALTTFLADNNRLVGELARLQQVSAERINLTSQPLAAP